MGMLTGQEELLPILLSYKPILLKMSTFAPKRHAQILAAYEAALAAIFTRELADLLEALKVSKIIKRNQEEKAFCRHRRRPALSRSIASNTLYPHSVLLHEQLCRRASDRRP